MNHSRDRVEALSSASACLLARAPSFGDGSTKNQARLQSFCGSSRVSGRATYPPTFLRRT